MNGLFAGIKNSRHAAPVAFLVALAFGYWSSVLIGPGVLLPGEFLRGFAPFGGDASAPWNILQWDALGQYYPWRVFAARQLQSGLIPLWNPHQFAGAPFLANGQSAIFYPLNFPFWLSFGRFDVAWAFGFSAWLHTILAALGTYFLLQRWRLSRASSVLGAVAFAFCGYLAAWVMLPTLANTASWLPSCLLLFERAVLPEEKRRRGGAEERRSKGRFSSSPLLLFSSSLCCALLAGHAQVFFYILVALLARALFLPKVFRSLSILFAACCFSALLGAIQILPTLELARLGHRANSSPTPGGWEFLTSRALQLFDLPSLFLPLLPAISLSENFGYVGLGVLLLSLAAVFVRRSAFDVRCWAFAFSLALFGLFYATATPLSQAFYFYVPGLSQMGGVGRALVLWSFGIALLAAFGLDALRRKWSTPVIPAVAILFVIGELFFGGMSAHPTAPRASIYPSTQVTQFLQSRSSSGARILFLTPRNGWLPTEALQPSGRSHPPGVLPPNGAMVYGLSDVNGYDSLAPRAYREFVAQGENLQAGEDVAPQLNGNMILLQNVASPALDALNVGTVVSQEPITAPNLTEILRADGVIVYARRIKNAPRRDGKDFSPGWKNGKYQPESFRFGAFISLLALLVCAVVVSAKMTARKDG